MSPKTRPFSQVIYGELHEKVQFYDHASICQAQFYIGYSLDCRRDRGRQCRCHSRLPGSPTGPRLRASRRLRPGSRPDGSPSTADTPAYWYLARAGGLLAYLLLWAASCWGIIMSSKAARTVLPPALVFSLHEFLPLLALLFTGVHAAALLGDSYFDFSVGNLLIPFTGPYRPGWTGLGTLAAYLSIVLIASFYVRRQLGRRTCACSTMPATLPSRWPWSMAS